ncbi:MAG: hypothetical protein H0U40_11015 [Chloroflexia bacterium]|nr:hypothetical protein [Chloroflexia bacterium]MDQ3514010.1 hypothetical protein [Chloroflexota bacterium]
MGREPAAWTLWAISLGSVLAVFGLVVWAMGRAYTDQRSLEDTVGSWLMIGGTLVLIIGGVAFGRASHDDAD